MNQMKMTLKIRVNWGILTQKWPFAAIDNQRGVTGVHVSSLGLHGVEYQTVIAEVGLGHATRTLPVQVTLLKVLVQAILLAEEIRPSSLDLGLGCAALWTA